MIFMEDFTFDLQRFSFTLEYDWGIKTFEDPDWIYYSETSKDYVYYPKQRTYSN